MMAMSFLGSSDESKIHSRAFTAETIVANTRSVMSEIMTPSVSRWMRIELEVVVEVVVATMRGETK